MNAFKIVLRLSPKETVISSCLSHSKRPFEYLRVDEASTGHQDHGVQTVSFKLNVYDSRQATQASALSR